MQEKINNVKLTLFVGFFFLIILPSYSSGVKDSVPLDPSIRRGKLPNGIAYYLKKIPNSSEEIEMRLVVKVGHNQEEPGQHQFAHLVEHLGFSSGQNISVNKSSELFDEMGIQMTHINGHTWNNYTDFMMKVPGSKKGAVNVALRFFEDIMWHLELTPSNIDKERTAVINEKNGGDFSFPVLLKRLEREVIGISSSPPENIVDHLQTFKPESLVQFYEEWYHPSSMAIIIVGNIDVEDIETIIREKFNRNTPPKNKFLKERSTSNYLQRDPIFLKREYSGSLDDPERKRAAIGLFIRQYTEESKNSDRILEDGVIRNLLVKMVNNRFRQKQEVYNSTFNGNAYFIDPPVALKLDVFLDDKLDEEIIQDAFKTLKEIELYGFYQKEFILNKEELMNSFSVKDTLETSYWMDGIIDYYVNNEVFPSNKNKILQDILKDLKLEEFNNKIKQYLSGTPNDIALAAHSGHPILSYSEEDIRNLFLEINSFSVQPFIPPHVPSSLIDSVSQSNLSKGYYKEGETPIPGAKKYILENGIKIILKPLFSKPPVATNIVSFQGFVQKGISCFPKKDFFSVVNIPAIVKNSGVGGLDKFELNRYLVDEGFQGSISPYIEYDESGIKGSVSLKDFETALQLVYLYFTDPYFTSVAFKDWKSTMKASFVHKDINREDLLSAIRETLPDNEFLPVGTQALAGIEQTDLSRAIEIYHQIFTNPVEYSFLIAGNFPEDEVLDLCRKYLGNLPISKKDTLSRKEDWFLQDISIEPFSKIVPSTKPMELAMVRLIYAHPKDKNSFTWKEEIKAEILRRAMMELLMRRLRFESDIGGTYQVVAGMNYVQLYEYNKYFIDFSCEPENVERLVSECREVVEALIKNPMDKDLFQKLAQGMVKYLNEPERLVDVLNNMYDLEKNGKVWINRSVKQDFINSLTPRDIWQSAREYLREDPYEYKMLSNSSLE